MEIPACLIWIALLFSSAVPAIPPMAPAGQVPPAFPKTITAVWANTGEDKVTRDERRATLDPAGVRNSVWDGSAIRLFGANNETVSFNLIIEAGTEGAHSVSVAFSALTGPGGYAISSREASGDGLFEFRGRNLELFYIRYLQIKGLSRLSYEDYDERHVPERMRRPWSGDGIGFGTWTDRPDHDKFYPDIAVPLELHSAFDIPADRNQSVWADIYIPPAAPPGAYAGGLTVSENGGTVSRVPVKLTVFPFSLPDLPAAKTMLFLSQENVNRRYLNESRPEAGTARRRQSIEITNRHFQMAHRHRVSLIDGYTEIDRLGDAWTFRLDGSLFTAAAGYEGPGVGIGNNVYSIGTYGSWPWQEGDETEMRENTDAWETWFNSQSFATPVERFLYLIDESSDYPQIEEWSQWINDNPGPGNGLMSMATISLTEARAHTPSLDLPATGGGIGITSEWEDAADYYLSRPDKRIYCYCASRPGSGSWATEDDGVSPRELAWGGYKKRFHRYFCWESTYYDNFQGGMGQTNVFDKAQTFGTFDEVDEVRGETGWNYNNGDGVLFYPGTDLVFPAESYGVGGPFASLRLKHWRRGIQDVDYLTLASAIDPVRVEQIVTAIIPKALWEYGVDDPEDPTWVRTDISWSNDPDVWEAARAELAGIISAGPQLAADSGDYNGDGRSEVAVFRTGEGFWAVRGITRLYFGSTAGRPVPADYDGNGTAEIAVFRNSIGLWAVRDLTRACFGGPMAAPVPADYDGDGDAEIAVFRSSTGEWMLRGVTRVCFGQGGDGPVPGDYDGDGTKELGVFRPLSGLWAVRDVTRIVFGTVEDRPVPGDYGGDGTWQPAVFRPGSGLWAVRGSSRFYFGTPGDRAVPADYDGDGRAAAAVFRNADGLWAVRDNTRVSFGEAGDVPVTR